MIFTPLPLAGAFRIAPALHGDERGFFARTFCHQEFAAHGLASEFSQCSVSFNLRRGTLRGLHYQADPCPETKLVRCTAGAIFDVMVDLRPDSPSYCRWYGEELSTANRVALYVPAGCAHGFLTLADATEVFYMMSVPYHPELARGCRWDDPAFAIAWPFLPVVMAARDREFGDFSR